ncbi:MAG TPA: hypothetical protein VMV53_12120 [Acidimicrobiales bacterium]|nr:hypothetical protein [Acidimicrobiales bacterium]
MIWTRAPATRIAGFGLFMNPLEWRYVAFVWLYALVWFLLTDRVKLLGYRLLDPERVPRRTVAPPAPVSDA